jgi:hypothetical protein
MLNKKYKIKKVYRPINKDSSSQENNSKMEEPLAIIIYKRTAQFTWCCAFEEVVKFVSNTGENFLCVY